MKDDEAFQFEVGEKVWCSLSLFPWKPTTEIIAERFLLGQKTNRKCYRTDQHPEGVNEIFLRKLTPLEQLL